MDLEAWSARLKVLADPTRVRLLALLEGEELTVAELSAIAGRHAIDDARTAGPFEFLIAIGFSFDQLRLCDRNRARLGARTVIYVVWV